MKLMQIDQKWQEKSILCQPKNKPINTTFYRQWKRIDQEDDKLRCLKVMLTKGYRAFLGSVTETLQKQRAEEEADVIPDTQVQAGSGDQDIFDDIDTIQNVEQNEESVNQGAEETSPEVNRLRNRCDKLEEENNTLKAENSRLRQLVKDLQSQPSKGSKGNSVEMATTTVNPNKKQTQNSSQKEKKRKNSGSDASSDVSVKKNGERKRQRITFEEGEKIEAIWKGAGGDKSWYGAKITEILGNGQFRVLFDDGIPSVVSKTWIRKETQEEES